MRGYVSRRAVVAVVSAALMGFFTGCTACTAERASSFTEPSKTAPGRVASAPVVADPATEIAPPVPPSAPQQEAPPAESSQPAPAPAPARSVVQPPPLDDPATQAAPEAPAEHISFKDCADAWAAGAAPLHKGDPGYSKELDKDGDGIACEHPPTTKLHTTKPKPKKP